MDAADRECPIVLVGGMMNWDRDELFGFKYFGAFAGDLQELLKQQNFRVYTASLGTLSSNWDRACELYALIKGGTVDYGARHSQHYGHKRYGSTFKGLYPEWGTLDPTTGSVRQIHLIGHSLGGQTIRVLSQMLVNGSKGAPVEEDTQKDMHPLFQGGRDNWIRSITTISTPHKGTLSAQIDDSYYSTFKRNAINYVATMIGLFPANRVLDLRLDQWGINRCENESIFAYVKRAMRHPIFRAQQQDTALYDVTIEGAEELNRWVQEQPNIFYFSLATANTTEKEQFYQGKLYNIHVPNFRSMFFPFFLFSLKIGGIQTAVVHRKSRDWHQNDGIVNTASMFGPTGSTVVHWDKSFEKLEEKTWHRLPVLDGLDHLAVCGLTLMKRTEIVKLYNDHAKTLSQLPKST